jgi:hypothetical protein
MLDVTTMKFSHVKPGDTGWRSDGLRDFFLYRDLGVEQATGRDSCTKTRTRWWRPAIACTSARAS